MNKCQNQCSHKYNDDARLTAICQDDPGYLVPDCLHSRPYSSSRDHSRFSRVAQWNPQKQKLCGLQVSNLYRPDALSVTQPKVSKLCKLCITAAASCRYLTLVASVFWGLPNAEAIMELAKRTLLKHKTQHSM